MTLIVLEPPAIEPSFFEDMKDEEKFAEFVRLEFEYEANRGALKPILGYDLMHDAYQAFAWDMDRLDKNMPWSETIDHYKSCGILVYWLRRFSPILQWVPTEEEKNLSQTQKTEREIISTLGRAYQAFRLGCGICTRFEMHLESEVKYQQYVNTNYLATVCYLMKYKNVSPHAMGMIYRSLFFAETEPTAKKTARTAKK